ncbi:MAG: hypothetical protein L0216_05735, partial [Planctomycetales bacterium]|nr:hypothetical protein [Planctomycetales bacterium]
MRGFGTATAVALATAAGCATAEPGGTSRPSRTMARLPEPPSVRAEASPEDAAGDPRPRTQG